MALAPLDDFFQANEDHNLYTFDMRKMNRAMMVHKDHVSAVYVTLRQVATGVNAGV